MVRLSFRSRCTLALMVFGICVTSATASYLLADMLPLVSWQPLRFFVMMVRNWAALNVVFSAVAAPVFTIFIFAMPRLE